MTDILQQVTELSFQYEAEFITWVPVIVLLTLALMLSYIPLRLSLIHISDPTRH